MGDTPIADELIDIYNEKREINTDYSEESSERTNPQIAG